MRTHLKTLTVIEAESATVLSIQFAQGRYRIDPEQHFAAAIRHDADPFEVALCLERLAGSIRRAARQGRLP